MSKTVALLRHAIRAITGKNLTQVGVNQAHAMTMQLPRPDRVISSPKPRAVQTAVAMGYAVDETFEEMAKMGADVDQDLGWTETASLAMLAGRLAAPGPAHAYARAQSALIREALTRVPDAGVLWVVSHGGVVECQLFGLLQAAAWPAHEPVFGRCEGAIVRVDADATYLQHILRTD